MLKEVLYISLCIVQSALCLNISCWCADHRFLKWVLWALCGSISASVLLSIKLNKIGIVSGKEKTFGSPWKEVTERESEAWFVSPACDFTFQLLTVCVNLILLYGTMHNQVFASLEPYTVVSCKMICCVSLHWG